MEITVVEQGLFLLPVKVNADQAKEKAWEQKLNIFGTLSKFLNRPKGEEIQVHQVEMRYQPFWHASSHKRFRYDRRGQYQVAVPPDVQSFESSGQTFKPAGGKFTLSGIDHCVFEDRQEIFVDGLTGNQREMKEYLAFEKTVPDATGAFALDVALVPPEIRASTVVRQVLGDVLHPAHADEIHEQEVMVDHLDLYYRPVYAFEYIWEAKAKRTMVEVDGLTGEFKPTGQTFGSNLKRYMDRDLLFDIGAQTLNLVVPGGAIALKIVKAVADLRRTEKSG